MTSRLSTKRALRLLDFATGFFNAATVLPLAFVLPAILLTAKPAGHHHRMMAPKLYLYGLFCGVSFAVACFSLVFTKR